MKGRNWILIAGGLVSLAAVCVAGGEDPVRVAPNSYRILFENDRVRVLDVHVKVGETIPMHAHPAHLIYAFSDAKVNFGLPGGRIIRTDLKSGQTIFNEGVTHSSQNAGDAEAHLLTIELKK